MAVLKVACPKCGQRVSGDESFYGTSVECPICTSKIPFPENPEAGKPAPREHPAEDPPADRPPPEAAPEAAPGGSPARETSSIPLPPKAPPAGAAVAGDDIPSPVMGVVSMVLGLVSIALFCLPGILFGPAAIICGHLARSRARHSSVQPAPGSGAALTGLILGYLSLAGFILVLVFLKDAVEYLRASEGPQ